MNCQKEKMAAGVPYPRTCEACGLFGPCRKGYDQRWTPGNPVGNGPTVPTPAPAAVGLAAGLSHPSLAPGPRYAYGDAGFPHPTFQQIGEEAHDALAVNGPSVFTVVGGVTYGREAWEDALAAYAVPGDVVVPARELSGLVRAIRDPGDGLMVSRYAGLSAHAKALVHAARPEPPSFPVKMTDGFVAAPIAAKRSVREAAGDRGTMTVTADFLCGLIDAAAKPAYRPFPMESVGRIADSARAAPDQVRADIRRAAGPLESVAVDADVLYELILSAARASARQPDPAAPFRPDLGGYATRSCRYARVTSSTGDRQRLDGYVRTPEGDAMTARWNADGKCLNPGMSPDYDIVGPADPDTHDTEVKAGAFAEPLIGPARAVVFVPHPSARAADGPIREEAADAVTALRGWDWQRLDGAVPAIEVTVGGSDAGLPASVRYEGVTLFRGRRPRAGYVRYSPGESAPARQTERVVSVNAPRKNGMTDTDAPVVTAEQAAMQRAIERPGNG